jgi:heme oxygenase
MRPCWWWSRCSAQSSGTGVEPGALALFAAGGEQLSEKLTPLRNLLRNSTTAAHAGVDRHFAAMFAAGLSGYIDFLRASAAAVLTLEQALASARVHEILPDWDARARSTALQGDLQALGVQPPAAHVKVAAVGGEARKFGMLYVLEGSRLGAKILARHVQASSDPRIRAAMRYLRHGEDQPFWPSFVARLEASTATARAPHEAVAGALAPFALFESSARLKSTELSDAPG